MHKDIATTFKHSFKMRKSTDEFVTLYRLKTNEDQEMALWNRNSSGNSILTKSFRKYKNRRVKQRDATGKTQEKIFGNVNNTLK